MSHSLTLEKYRGKIAVVTGASSGIGKSIAEALVKRGLLVAAIARRVHLLRDHAQQLQNEPGKLYPFDCDLQQRDQILATFQRITSELGPIHVLVNNAGLLFATTIIDGDIDKWEPVLDVNVRALAICTREAVASMTKNNLKGHVVNINAVAGHLVPDIPDPSIYPASKHAVTALTETVRKEIIRKKLPLKISSISPGYTRTEFGAKAWAGRDMEDFYNHPALEAQDVTDAVLYVLSTPDHVNVNEIIMTVQGEIY